MKIYINPGHDLRYDPGAVNRGAYKGLNEAGVVYSIGRYLQEYLEAVGHECLSRQSDNLCHDSEYPDRDIAVVDEANDWGADLFISIHCNACNTKARGTECWVYAPGSPSESIAECIQEQIVDSLWTIDRGVKAQPNFIVLRDTDMPAVLVETAFIDNDEDAELLADNQREFAAAIARGVTDALG